MTRHTIQAKGRQLRQCPSPSGQRADALDCLTRIVYPDPNQAVNYDYDLAPTVCAATCEEGKSYRRGTNHGPIEEKLP